MCLAGAHEKEVGSQHEMATLLDQVPSCYHMQLCAQHQQHQATYYAGAMAATDRGQ